MQHRQHDHSRQRRGHVRSLIGIVVLAAVTGGACAGDDGTAADGDDTTDGTVSSTSVAEAPPAAPALQQRWEAPADRTTVQPRGPLGTLTPGEGVWISESVVSLPTEGSFRGYDPESGEERWQLSLPDGLTSLCAMSTELNGDGIGGVLVGPAAGRCTHAAAIDTVEGTVLWHRSLGEQDEDLGNVAVSVADESLTADVSCGEVRRFSLAGGDELPSPQQRDRLCAHEADHNGNLLAMRNVPDSDAAPDDHGTDWVPPHDGEATLMLHDADSGEQRWQRPVPIVGSALHGIVADDPVTLDTTEGGHRFVRVYDATGKPVRTIGKRLGIGSEMTVFGVSDGVLVARYGHRAHVFAYDLATGDERWAEALAGMEPLGLQRGGLLAVRRVYADANEPTMPELQIVRHDLGDGAAVELGRIELDGVDVHPLGWDDDRLYLFDRSTERVVAFELPAVGGPVVEAARPVDEPPANRWSDGDRRAEDVDGSCEVVRAETLTSLGLRTTDLPPPATCEWLEDDEPGTVTRIFSATASAHPPSNDRSATEVASAAFDDQIARVTPVDRPTEGAAIAGLGDAAWGFAVASPDGSSMESRIVARHRNVVVTVSFEIEVLRHDDTAEAPRHVVEGALLDAAEAIMGSLDGPDDPASVPDPGVFRAVVPLCALLQGQATAVVPDNTVVELTPGDEGVDRATACSWSNEREDRPSLRVHAYAVAGSPITGADAATVATEMLEGTRSGVPVDGLGDAAIVWTSGVDAIGSRRLAVRQDNLLIVVELTRHGVTSDDLEVAVDGMARTVLAAHT